MAANLSLCSNCQRQIPALAVECPYCGKRFVRAKVKPASQFPVRTLILFLATCTSAAYFAQTRGISLETIKNYLVQSLPTQKELPNEPQDLRAKEYLSIFPMYIGNCQVQ